MRFCCLVIGGALVAAGMGCGDDPTGSGVPAARVGTYVLETLDGTPLPESVAWNGIPVSVVADTLFLADQTFTIRTTTAAGSPIFEIAGTVVVRGDSVFLRDSLLGSIAAEGAFDDLALRLVSVAGHHLPGHDWLYFRIP